MGTNFYTLSGIHAGKRSAAGPYCWDCGITLCKDGNDGIHKSCNHPNILCNCKWYDACPNCGKKTISRLSRYDILKGKKVKLEDLNNSSAGRELGFNTSKPKKKKGVASCSSFSWSMDPEKFNKSKIKFIKDEYGRKFTRKEFQDILEECPVQYTNMTGIEFS
jgi:hypothetical protein